MTRRQLLLTILLFAAVSAFAQNTTSGITGRVKCGDDVLESVNIQIVNEEHGGNYGTTTNRYGIYTVSGLHPGVYDAVFSYIGYKTVRCSGITLALGEEYVLDVTMETDNNLIGDIDVVADYTHFNETKTGQTYSIRGDRMELLPSVERSLLDYTRLSIYSGNDNSMAGRDGRTTTLSIDGAGLSNSFGLSADLPGGGNPVSVDAIDEVQVVIAPYDVSQGNFTGGGINAVTKSGTNTFRATAYTYQRNENFRGNSVDGHSLGERKSESKSVYGFTAGGPILRDRLFFFVNGEAELQPQPISEWTLSDDGNGDAAAMKSRVTEADMNRFATALSRYGYDAGTTDLGDGGTDNFKVLARLDWNISERHNLMVRYNYTANSTWYTPNNTSTVGTTASSNRVSQNAYAFRNNCYTIRDEAWSAVTELDSRLGRLSNRLLLTASMVGNSRGSDSEEFPHVDIWKDGDAFMSAGYELFSHTGNSSFTYTCSDNMRWTVGHSTLSAGIGYDLRSVSTNYMSYATGYYKYASIEDFEAGNAPLAFGYTYAYDGVDDPSSKCTIGQGTAYLQSETRIMDRLKLTYGIRADVTGYHNALQTNLSYRYLDWTGHFFAAGEDIPSGWKSPSIDTGRWPDRSVQLSPRIGFNWSVLQDASLVVHGGAGLFAGRIPMVFMTNMPNYSNLMQNTVIVTNDADGLLSGLGNGNFLYRQEDIRAYLEADGYTMSADPQAPVRNASVCGVTEDFKLPQVMKTSVAADWTLPVSFPAVLSVEGIYNKDINAVCSRNLNIMNAGSFQRFNGPDDRVDYNRTDASGRQLLPYVNQNVTGGAMLLDNTDLGYSWSVSASARLEPVRGLKIELSYIHQDAMCVSDMTGSSLHSTWKNVASVDGPNELVLHRSQYVTPDRVTASVTYNIVSGSRFATSLGLFYNGCNPGSYSYRYMNDMNGDGVTNDLIHIPASKDEILFVDNGTYTAAEQQEAFWEFVTNDDYLKSHKGEYAGANEALMPWLNRFDIRVAETLRVGGKRDTHKVQVSLDLMNVGNLLCDKWGVQSTPSACNDGKILKFEREATAAAGDGIPRYTLYSNSEGLLKETFRPLQSISNCWYLQLGIRYYFN